MWSVFRGLAKAESGSGARFLVYEAWNATLHEILVGFTEGDLHDLLLAHRKRPLAQIAHWREDHRVDYRVVEEGLPAEEAEEFARIYGQTCMGRMFKVFVAR